MVHVPKRKRNRPGRLTVHEIVILLGAISVLLLAMQGKGPL